MKVGAKGRGFLGLNNWRRRTPPRVTCASGCSPSLPDDTQAGCRESLT